MKSDGPLGRTDGVKLLRPLPAPAARLLSTLVVVAWLVQMGVLVRKAFSSTPLALAADLASYGSSAHWRGIYYRGDKIGFSVGQTTPSGDGYEIREDARLQMNLVGATTAVRMTSRAVVDRAFALRSFSFSLDPGTGPTDIEGTLDGLRLDLVIRNSAGERRESRQLPEAPALSLNLPRALAARGLEPGQTHVISVFDPATLRNTKMTLQVQAREIVRAAGRPVPAFRVEGRFAGVTTRSWITDVGEVVREESPMGLQVVRETQAQAQTLAVPGTVQADMLEASALVPSTRGGSTTRARSRGCGFGSRASAASTRADMQGAGQSSDDGTIEVKDARDLAPAATPGDLDRYLGAEAFLESDAPEIRAEAEKATAGAATPRLRAERLTRHVHAIVEKRPTVSLPSARRGAADARRRLQRAHGALRRDGALAGPAGAHRGRARVPARGLLLPRLARGLDRRDARPRACGSPSIRRSTSSRPTPRTCASPAAASTGRPRSSA